MHVLEGRRKGVRKGGVEGGREVRGSRKWAVHEQPITPESTRACSAAVCQAIS